MRRLFLLAAAAVLSGTVSAAAATLHDVGDCDFNPVGSVFGPDFELGGLPTSAPGLVRDCVGPDDVDDRFAFVAPSDFVINHLEGDRPIDVDLSFALYRIGAATTLVRLYQSDGPEPSILAGGAGAYRLVVSYQTATSQTPVPYLLELVASPAPVPLPAALPLLGLGLAGLALTARRRRA